MDKTVLWLWLRLALKGNRKLMYALYRVAGDIVTIYRANRQTYLDWGLPDRYALKLDSKDTRRAEQTAEMCSRHGYRIVTLEDDAYPAGLREIALPPCLLFYDGDLSGALQAPAVTITGTRYATATGHACAAEFARDLACAGFTVVCGIAEGIEKTVHTALVQADGRCILVLPSGLHTVSRRVAELIRQILPRGAVISEQLPDEKQDFDAYPMRNRILSGLSVGTLVVQAPKKSGSLTIAENALEQGREVFALPGGARDPSYAGNNQLLLDGAHPVVDASHIVDFFLPRFPELTALAERDTEFENFFASVTEGAAPVFTNKTQAQIYGALTDKPQFMDEIAAKSDLSVPTVMTELVRMELAGWIEAAPGGAYKIIS